MSDNSIMDPSLGKRDNILIPHLKSLPSNHQLHLNSISFAHTSMPFQFFCAVMAPRSQPPIARHILKWSCGLSGPFYHSLAYQSTFHHILSFHLKQLQNNQKHSPSKYDSCLSHQTKHCADLCCLIVKIVCVASKCCLLYTSDAADE